MADYRAIMALLLQGRSYRQIVDAVGCSHRDVSAARKTLDDRGLNAGALAEMSDVELAGLFPDGRSKVSAGYDLPDFAQVVKSMKANPHFTLLQSWRTYVGARSVLRKYGYAQYCHLFGRYAVKNDLVATLHHEPGMAMFVDWAGDTIPIADAVAGRSVKAYLFVAVLPFSGYVFCQAFTDMRSEAWVNAHVNAFSFYQGIPQIVVPDNTLTATHRKTKGDAARFVNDKYRHMADHYGTAIVPARVRSPRDYPEDSVIPSPCRRPLVGPGFVGPYSG
ncbi:DDE-type integrase/transposase/recombinase [Arthrobacter psychrolactophilus]